MKNSEGFVYFVQAYSGGSIKIGHASDFQARLSALRSSSPVALRVLGVIASPEARRLEIVLHDLLAELRTHGEWFRPEHLLTDFIADHAAPWPGEDDGPTEAELIWGQEHIGKLLEPILLERGFTPTVAAGVSNL